VWGCKWYTKHMSGFWSEFKNFAVKGNAFDLAVAVVIGTAFTAVVNALVADIITPLIGLITPGSGDLKNAALTLWPAQMQNGTTTPAIVLAYGNFLQTVINFFLIALSIFVIFKLVSSARKRIFRERKQTPPAQKSDEVLLLEEIRDLLKGKKEV
jgi:large conductance mechanosensitive channel